MEKAFIIATCIRSGQALIAKSNYAFIAEELKNTQIRIITLTGQVAYYEGFLDFLEHFNSINTYDVVDNREAMIKLAKNANVTLRLTEDEYPDIWAGEL